MGAYCPLGKLAAELVIEATAKINRSDGRLVSIVNGEPRSRERGFWQKLITFTTSARKGHYRKWSSKNYFPDIAADYDVDKKTIQTRERAELAFMQNGVGFKAGAFNGFTLDYPGDTAQEQ